MRRGGTRHDALGGVLFSSLFFFFQKQLRGKGRRVLLGFGVLKSHVLDAIAIFFLTRLGSWIYHLSPTANGEQASKQASNLTRRKRRQSKDTRGGRSKRRRLFLLLGSTRSSVFIGSRLSTVERSPSALLDLGDHVLGFGKVVGVSCWCVYGLSF